jgi:hypothetical protein
MEKLNFILDLAEEIRQFKDEKIMLNLKFERLEKELAYYKDAYNSLCKQELAYYKDAYRDLEMMIKEMKEEK